MKGLEALKTVKKLASAYAGDKYAETLTEEIEKELKALEIIKNKKVNIYHIWVFDNYTQYKEHYKFSEYHAIEDMLTFEEFDLLKKQLNYENE